MLNRIALAPAVIALVLAACGKESAPPDPYDQSKMDLKPLPAKVSGVRHKGAFAEGSALSTGPELKALDPAPVKTIRLDTTHKIIEIAPGVKYSAWTFGDQVPGPIIRARVGDKIRFSMTNRSDEAVPAPQLSPAAPMMHSMDFHAAMVSPQDKYRSIAPGQTIEFEFTLNYPGVFMYHCGTPMILEHIASGMYGALVVEPRNGYPTKVNREYVVIQSEFYAKAPPKGSKSQVYTLDGEAVRAARPNYTVFNGRFNGMVDQPLQASPGERVRLFLVNVGPSKTSSFHVVGTIFDRVWMEGNPDNQFRGMQTVLLGSSNSAHRRVRDPRGRLLHHGRPPLRQRLAGRARPHLHRSEAAAHRARAPQLPRLGAAERRRSGAGQARLREQVLRLPLARPRPQARTRSRRRDEAAQRRLDHALAQVARGDARQGRPGEGAAQGVQRRADAEPESLREGDPPVPEVLPVVRRAARRVGSGFGRRALA
jgi:plastocyanin